VFIVLYLKFVVPNRGIIKVTNLKNLVYCRCVPVVPLFVDWYSKHPVSLTEASLGYVVVY